MRNKKLVPYTVIVAAKSGDPDAMHKILTHYGAFFCLKMRLTMRRIFRVIHLHFLTYILLPNST